MQYSMITYSHHAVHYILLTLFITEVYTSQPPRAVLADEQVPSEFSQALPGLPSPL